jgi:hypothetical protein
MTEDEMKAFMDAITALRDDVVAQVGKLDEKCGALADSVTELKKKADTAGERDRGVDASMRRRGDEDADPVGEQHHAARRVAADSIGAAEFSALCSVVADLKKKVVGRPQATLDAYADTQSKADAVMRAHGERAEPWMAGEDLVSYKIRQHRPMQKHSAKWKGVELSAIAGDGKAFENILAEIRADALQAGLKPVGLPEFQWREITQQMPGGHLVKTFHGNGTIFKQLSRPVRHVAYIGTRSGIGTGRPYATS